MVTTLWVLTQKLPLIFALQRELPRKPPGLLSYSR